MIALHPEVTIELEKMLTDLDFSQLYREYSWKNDSYVTGFSDLFDLEKEISAAAKKGAINRNHLEKIGLWGKLPNVKGIKISEPLEMKFYDQGHPLPKLLEDPVEIITQLKKLVKGFGPTNCSKILHFAVPEVFGALDSRLVRALGNSGCEYHLLKLDAEKCGTRWQITPSQPNWPDEFGTWIQILNYLANRLNQDKKQCPHPEKYYQENLRINDVWLPADVETALFSYASKLVKPKSDKFEQFIGYTFHNKKILSKAITRRSFLNDLHLPQNNCMEPLSTLGDAVLDLVVIKRLYNDKGKTEADISIEKSEQVKRQRTQAFFFKYQLFEFIRWGKGESGQKIWEKGDEAPDTATEALIGAIFLDAQNCGENGLQIVQDFLESKKFFEK